MFVQFRWYYNGMVTVFYMHYDHVDILREKKYSPTVMRDIFRKYEYWEEEKEGVIHKGFFYNEDTNKFMVPEWWKGKVNLRLPRGAINKFVYSLNSALSNYRNGNTTEFKMKYRSKKGNTDYLHFEDKSFPSFIRDIKGRYFYTTRDRKRKTISFPEIISSEGGARGLEIIYEKNTGKYFLHYPVRVGWFPNDDRRNDNQVRLHRKGERMIALDPGVRKFMVGYDPEGTSVFVGEGASDDLIELLYDIDKEEDRDMMYFKWRRVKNLIGELHWKTISFLIKNYDIILLPHFRISEMVKGRKLGRRTKRLLYMFSYHSFKEKLMWKCKTYGKKLFLVDESYTSCTCGNCGTINRRGGAERYECKCGLKIDRDAMASRNILIKNITLR